jgi:hypothetical protein
MAVGSPGQLWLTRTGSPDQSPVVGELLRFDASAGQATLNRPVGGDPEAVAYSGAYVWVVDGFGDGKTLEADANSVIQLDATTADEAQRYQVDQPYGLGALGDLAWIAAAGPADTTMVTIAQAQAGTVSGPVVLPGGNAAGSPVVVAGGNGAFVVTTVSEPGQPGHNTVYAVDGTGQVTAQQVLPTFGNAALAFGDGAVFASVMNVQVGGIYRLDGATLTLNATLSNDGARGITTANGHVWALSLDGTYVRAYDAVSGLPTSQRVILPGRGNLLAADDQQVWVSTEVNSTSELVLVAPS